MPSSTSTSGSTEAELLRLTKDLKEENIALHETNQTLVQHKLDLLQELDTVKHKLKQTEGRLMDSMKQRASRETSFQQQIQTQRKNMHQLFQDLVSSKRQCEEYQHQLKEANAMLQMQQELTANIAFEQEDDGSDSDGDSDNDVSPKHPTQPQHRWGTFFQKQIMRQGLPQHKTGNEKSKKQLVEQLTRENAALKQRLHRVMEAQQQQQQQKFASWSFEEEEKKHDITSDDGAESLADFHSGTTATTAASSLSSSYSSNVGLAATAAVSGLSPPPPLPYSPLRRDGLLKEQEQLQKEEMNYGEASYSLQNTTTTSMSKLDLIRQKRRSLETLWRNSPIANSNSASNNKLPTSPSSLHQQRQGRNRAPSNTVSATWNHSTLRNHNVNLMNHRTED